MPAAVRSYVTAGVALVGASVISVTPVTPGIAQAQQPEARTVTADVDLTASAANILPNLINAMLNAPQAHVDAVNFWAESWAKSGNWGVYSQVNVLGWDPPNVDMAYSTVALMVPFKPLWQPYGEATESWMAANLPMHYGCSGLPPCPDSASMLNSMFRVNPLSFYLGNGFTYGAEDGPEGTPKWNPVSSRENYWGYELGEDASADFKIKDENGNPTDQWDPALYDEATGKPTELGMQLYPNSYIGWHGETRKLDPNAGNKAFWDYLMGDPQPVKFPSFDEQMTAYRKFAETLAIMWNPFMPQSYIWNPRYSTAAYFVRPFAKYLCPHCNPYDPFMPVGWKPSDGFPEPVDDGWQPLFPWQAKTPTGLPLPTEDYLEPGYVAPEQRAAQESTAALLVSDTTDATDETTAEDTSAAESDLSKTLQAIQAKATDILTPQTKTEDTTPVADEVTTPVETEVPAEPEVTTPVETETPAEPEVTTPAETEAPQEAETPKETPKETEAAKETANEKSDPVADAVKSVRDKFKRGSEARESRASERAGNESSTSTRESSSTSTSSSRDSSSRDSGSSGNSSDSKRTASSGASKGSDS